MSDKISASLQRFLDASPYRAVVDRKKLTFVYDSIMQCCKKNRRSPESLQILDAACGSGGIALPLATLGAHVHGFDLSIVGIQALSAVAQAQGLANLELSIDNGLTFDDGKRYDIVVLSEVLEHVLEPERLLANLGKRMDSGSHLIVTVPNGYGPWEMRNRIDPYQLALRSNLLRRILHRPRYVRGSGPGHVQFYTLGRFSKLLADQSFQIINKSRSDTVLTAIPLARRIPFIARMDIQLADRLPYSWANGWYFLCQRL